MVNLEKNPYESSSYENRLRVINLDEMRLNN